MIWDSDMHQQGTDKLNFCLTLVKTENKRVFS